MRKIKLFISLLFVLFISIGQTWGADPTKTTTFTSNSFNVDGWSMTSTTSIQGYTSPNVQVTWNAINSKSLVLENSTDYSGKTIKKVAINCRTNGNSGTFSVSVGGTSLGDAQTISSSTQGDVSISHNTGLTGTIQITISSSSTSKSCYIKSITVTYVDGSGNTCV